MRRKLTLIYPLPWFRANDQVSKDVTRTLDRSGGWPVEMHENIAMKRGREWRVAFTVVFEGYSVMIRERVI